jgi:hypothetical protein
MERRMRRLEAASFPALLRELATVAAAAAGLDPELVRVEAERILADVNRGRTLGELVAADGIDPDAALAEAADLLARCGRRERRG